MKARSYKEENQALKEELVRVRAELSVRAEAAEDWRQKYHQQVAVNRQLEATLAETREAVETLSRKFAVAIARANQAEVGSSSKLTMREQQLRDREREHQRREQWLDSFMEDVKRRSAVSRGFRDWDEKMASRNLDFSWMR